MRGLFDKVGRSSDHTDRGFRMLRSKAASALDKVVAENAILRFQKKELEQQVEDLRPKKRQKVVPTEGAGFVRIEQIQAARIAARAKETYRAFETAGEMLEIPPGFFN